MSFSTDAASNAANLEFYYTLALWLYFVLTLWFYFTLALYPGKYSWEISQIDRDCRAGTIAESPLTFRSWRQTER